MNQADQLLERLQPGTRLFWNERISDATFWTVPAQVEVFRAFIDTTRSRPIICLECFLPNGAREDFHFREHEMHDVSEHGFGAYVGDYGHRAYFSFAPVRSGSSG